MQQRNDATEAAAATPHEGGAPSQSDRHQLIKTLTKITAHHAANSIPRNKQEDHNHLADDHDLQKEMLNDPRFGSPLLCDFVVMALALVPLLCGMNQYFAPKSSDKSQSGFHYGLALCGLFIFLLGLRSACIHLTNRPDTTEERVLYILEKFGGTMWIPKIPEVTQVEPEHHASDEEVGDSAAQSESRPFRLVLDPTSASVFQLSDRPDNRRPGRPHRPAESSLFDE